MDCLPENPELALERLAKSSFRASFHLTKKEREYYLEKGADVMRSHAADFVEKRIASAYPDNDGKQTPMSGHPAFKAMHACGCCCRGCLNKWYQVPIGVPLNGDQKEKIVRLLTAWMEKQMQNL